MKVLRLDGDRVAGTPELTLHPQLTVVRNLSGPARAWLLQALGRIDTSATATATGEVEASGVILPFTDATMALLGLDEARDGVVTPQQLGVAGPLPGSVERAGSTDAATDGDQHQRGDTEAATSVARAVEVADPPEAVDPPRPRKVGPSPIERRITALRQRRVELARLVDGIQVVDVTELRPVLDALEQAPATTPRPGAAELADAWRDLQTDLKGLEIGASPEERAATADVATAQAAVAEAEAILRQPRLTDEQIRRIEAAHAAYSEAADRVDRRFGGGRARKQLAEAEAEELRLLRRFGFESWVDYMLNTAKRAADPDRTEERAALETAREELEACIAELDAIPGAVGRRRRRAVLQERKEALSDRVAEVLGHEPVGDDVEAELRGLVIPADLSAETSVVVTALERAGGEPPRDRDDVDEVIAAARHVVARSTQAQRRRGELTDAVDALDRAIEVLDEAREDGATVVPAMDPLPEMAEPPVGFLDADDLDAPAGTDEGVDGSGADPTVAPEADQLALDIDDARTPAGGERSPAPQGSVDHALGDADAPAADDAAAEAEGVRRLFDLPGGGATSTTEPATSDGTDRFIARDLHDRAALVDDILWESLQLVAAARAEVPAGQLPVVFDEPFGLLDADECLEVLARLARYTDEVQMVVLTDRPEVIRWATAIGPEHAAVVG